MSSSDHRTTLAGGLLVLTLGMLSGTARADDTDAPPRFGVALNSSVNGEVYPVRLVPTATLLVDKNQLEAGVGLHPFIRRDQRVWSGELNYKRFPNGTERPLSLYLISRLSYVHLDRETYYPTTYHYLFVNGGYGLKLQGDSPVYFGTNTTIGIYTFARSSENPYPGFDSDSLFAEWGVNLAFQANIGVRF